MVIRPSIEIKRTEDERSELERLARGRRVGSLSDRPHIVLLAAEGLTSVQIGNVLGATDQTAKKWRTRFAEQRMERLEDEFRSARPRCINDDAVPHAKKAATTRPAKWTYFYLYVVLDIFSRYAVGWMVADRENSALAGRLIEETCHKQGVQPQVLTLHSDRGASMTSKCTAQLLADLGVTRSLSRPQVSDDNPFSEAQFKTLKYHPGFPGRFHDITAAIAFCRTFFPWYNTEHRHGGIAMLTPDDVHHNRTQSVLEQRGRTLQAAWTRHPERFVRGIPQPDPLPQAVWINPPVTPTTGETAQ